MVSPTLRSITLVNTKVAKDQGYAFVVANLLIITIMIGIGFVQVTYWTYAT
jgi:hypothetical protein